MATEEQSTQSTGNGHDRRRREELLSGYQKMLKENVAGWCRKFIVLLDRHLIPSAEDDSERAWFHSRYGIYHVFFVLPGVSGANEPGATIGKGISTDTSLK